MSAEELIRKFYITPRYKGYKLILDAIQISITNYGEYIQITNDVYIPLSFRYKVSLYCIERNIRTVVEKCWVNNKDLVFEIFGYKPAKCPSNSEFIDYISYYIMKNNDEK